MMRNSLLALLLITVSSAASASRLKTGIVNMQKIILQVEEGKAAKLQLQKEIKEKEVEFKKQKAELDELNASWKRQAALLSEEARMKKQADFQQKFMKLRNEEMQFQSIIKQKEVAATQKIAMNVAAIVDKLAKKKNLDVVFETNSSGLMYAKDPVDLTNDVIASYDKNSQKGKAGIKAKDLISKK